MALTADERKKLLGRGGLARVARRTRRTPSHVSQVNRFPELRRDEKVIGAISEIILKKNPAIKAEDVWPMAG